MIRTLGLAALAWLAVFSESALAETDERARAKQAVERSQSVINTILPPLEFTDIDGKKVNLSRFRGKPLLITMIYTACVDVCPLLIQNLHPAVADARGLFGEDGFSVITVGFDVQGDTPQRMRSFRNRAGQPFDNWHFLSGDEANVDALERSIGVGIYARAGGFDHVSQITFVDGNGRIVQQVYGASFEPPLVIEPLKDLIYGRFTAVKTLDAIIDRIKLFCTIYDPTSGRYYFNYSIFIGLTIGSCSLAFVGFVLVREWRRTRSNPDGIS